MGKILGLNTSNDDKVIVKLELTQKEAIYLQGNLKNIHIFSEENLNYPARLVQRGKRDSTKYFLLPKEFRKGISITQDVKCNKIETKTKNIFIFETKKYY